MKEINLTREKRALVDDEDFDRVNKLKWHCSDQGYAMRRSGPRGKSRKNLRMARFILNARDGLEVDHIDGNKLNNQKSNLRVCMHRENSFNKSKQKTCASSMFKGVSWNNRRRKWYSYIKLNYKFVHLGVFGDEREAALAYDRAATRHHGQFAKLNFRQDREAV